MSKDAYDELGARYAEQLAKSATRAAQVTIEKMDEAIRHMRDEDLHSCGPHCERDACVAAREAAAAERARIIAMLREMHDKVKPMHNYYAYAANVIEAME